MFTKIHVSHIPDKLPVPARGFYVAMQYMYGDADGEAARTVGPFPSDRHDMVLEFLNLCQAMLDRYPDGKSGWDGYEDVPMYSAYFDEDYDGPNGPDQDIRWSVGAETEYVPDGSGCIAKLTGYDVYYHDGDNPHRYPVTLR